jgi:hypothetical protein
MLLYRPDQKYRLAGLLRASTAARVVAVVAAADRRAVVVDRRAVDDVASSSYSKAAAAGNVHPWEVGSFVDHPWEVGSFVDHPWEDGSFVEHPWAADSWMDAVAHTIVAMGAVPHMVDVARQCHRPSSGSDVVGNYSVLAFADAPASKDFRPASWFVLEDYSDGTQGAVAEQTAAAVG